MVPLNKEYRARCSGAVYKVVATDTDGVVTLLHTIKSFTVRFPEAHLPKVFEEVV